jgi:hypothetical protein
MRPETTEALHTILDVMTGADGGGQFVLFKTNLEALDRLAAEGDIPARRIIEGVVLPFSRLVNLGVKDDAAPRA